MHIYNVLLQQVYKGYFEQGKPDNILFCYGTANRVVANIEPSHQEDKYYVTLQNPDGLGLGRFLFDKSVVIMAATTDQTFVENHLQKFDSFFED